MNLSEFTNLVENAEKLYTLSDALMSKFSVETEEIPVDRLKSIAETYDRFINKKGKSKFPAVKTNGVLDLYSAVFPRFNSMAATVLPGGVDPISIISHVVDAQNYRPKIRAQWKALLTTEAAIYLLQDVFWWIFLDSFDFTNSNSGEDQEKLHARIAKNFVAVSVFYHARDDDEILFRFADILAQAVFTAFCIVFPENHKLFDISMRKKLISTIYDWMFGLQPKQDSWKLWNVSVLGFKCYMPGESQVRN